MQPGKLTLFCFPYAGGGTLLYRGWRDALPETAIVAARLPGRESRLGEPPIDSMEGLVDALGPEFVPHLREPFAFFGHSMGAILAFELIRWLRDRQHPMPVGLHVSAARAPQYRLNHQPGPEPDERLFLEDIRKMEGTPGEVLDNPELMRLILPALRADANLYRKYVYRPGEPLLLPIHAYGGLSDPNIQREHLERWCEQTEREFSVRLFEGGHFYIQHAQAEFLAALHSKLI